MSLVEWFRDGKRRCLFGALEYTCGDNDRAWAQLIGIALRELKISAGIAPSEQLVDWNDAQPGIESVLAVIDRTIERVREHVFASYLNAFSESKA